MINYIRKLSIIILLALPFYLLLRRPWRRKQAGEWALGAFFLFNLGLLALALEGEYADPALMLRRALSRIDTGEGINLVPLRTIRGFFRDFQPELFMVIIVGNIVMFFTWGYGMALLWEKNRKTKRILLYSLALPLFIETAQLFVGRNVDVDDLILNFAGGCLGAGSFNLAFSGRQSALQGPAGRTAENDEM